MGGKAGTATATEQEQRSAQKKGAGSADDQKPSSSGDASSTAPKKTKKPATLTSALSGAISGALVSACVQPLDVVKTKMQADAAQGFTRGPLQTLTKIISEHGVRGLWQGTGPSVIRVGLGAGLHFVLLEQIRYALTTTNELGVSHLSNMGAALSGGLSRAVATALLCPVTVVKTRMEYVGSPGTAARYRDTFDALATITRTEGMRGLFKGLGPTILTNAPYSGLYYMFYTRLKDALSSEDRPQALVNFSSGLAAAVAATLLTQPTDVIRTRIQLGITGTGASAASSGAVAGAAAAGASSAAAARVSTNMWATLQAVLKQQGAGGLLIGAAPRILKRTSQTALVWTLYEELVPRVSALGIAAKQAMLAQTQQAQQQQQAGK